MGGPSLRCQTCGGKFGLANPAGQCDLCWTWQRVKDHLLSPRCPGALGPQALTLVKECYYKLLDTSEFHWGLSERAAQGAKGERLEEKREEPPPSERFTAEDKAQDLYTSCHIAQEGERIAPFESTA